jgi:hypothetical protein
MPPLQATRGKDGHLRINDGVTRATRAAKLRPGEHVMVEIIHELPTRRNANAPRPGAIAMRERTELLATLAELSSRYPTWRLGQLICNVADWADRDLWDIDDAQMLEAIKSNLERSIPDPSATHASS